ncbi:hypothetical protein G7K_0368-t1 [Saitoella complicata NRRL Y-17804]|uniref:alpha-amylase n=2 Tax=Saitoella complicata (strain BCRC 22490 / CBS 7301 / JCM 7358 / NBRC 10748 / NRRL Y-17804) TaxID=698492 RepID=A0A0E9N8H8_SAICN|nr:hypothetical protein G7K_0368-t1 [Saitoella complicata NRRL Y-17804]
MGLVSREIWARCFSCFFFYIALSSQEFLRGRNFCQLINAKKKKNECYVYVFAACRLTPSNDAPLQSRLSTPPLRIQIQIHRLDCTHGPPSRASEQVTTIKRLSRIKEATAIYTHSRLSVSPTFVCPAYLPSFAMRFAIPALLANILAPSIALAAHAAQWREKPIYQVITDRFAREDNATTSVICDSGTDIYCGGSWQGIINQLDYIQDMGFGGIWISPIVKNIENYTQYGWAYHGYWVQDYYALNPHFGNESDLIALSDALHARDMYLMVDIIVNDYAQAAFYHNSPDSRNIDYSQFHPFNKEEYFHPWCWADFSNQTSTEDCWTGDINVPLPDLNQSIPYVHDTLLEWIAEVVSNYSVDGIRLDAVKSVPIEFWHDFNKSSNVYNLGENFDGDASYVCNYQNKSMDGLLNYPMYGTVLTAFSATNGSFESLNAMIATMQEECVDPTTMGNFLENQDTPRFCSFTNDRSLYLNALTWNFLSDGIPILYYGQEHYFNGTADPYNREGFFSTGYNRSSEAYAQIRSLNLFRQKATADDATFLETYGSAQAVNGDRSMGYVKGDVVILFNNYGEDATDIPSSAVSLKTSWSNGDSVTEILTGTTYTVGASGALSVKYPSNGWPQVFYPTSQLGSDNFVPTIQKTPKLIQTATSTSTGSSATGGSGSSSGAVAVGKMGVEAGLYAAIMAAVFGGILVL